MQIELNNLSQNQQSTPSSPSNQDGEGTRQCMNCTQKVMSLLDTSLGKPINSYIEAHEKNLRTAAFGTACLGLGGLLTGGFSWIALSAVAVGGGATLRFTKKSKEAALKENIKETGKQIREKCDELRKLLKSTTPAQPTGIFSFFRKQPSSEGENKKAIYQKEQEIKDLAINYIDRLSEYTDLPELTDTLLQFNTLKLSPKSRNPAKTPATIENSSKTETKEEQLQREITKLIEQNKALRALLPPNANRPSKQTNSTEKSNSSSASETENSDNEVSGSESD